MTTESVLEKLKQYREMQKLELWDSEDDDLIDDWNDIAWWYDYELTPRLIAALELVEEKAKETTSAHLYDFNLYDYADSSVNDAFDLGVDTGLIDFAREVLALLDGENENS